MKSGMLAADSVADALLAGKEGGDVLNAYVDAFKASWLHEELFASRNFGVAIHKYGAIKGGAFNFIDQNIFGGKLPFTLHDTKPDYACLKLAADSKKIDYPKPDGKLSFDKLSSVFLSSTNHEEEQPCHLKLTDPSIPISKTCRCMTSRLSVIARLACMKSSPRKTARNASRSTRRTACTARPATSRTRRRTSPGWHRKALVA